ncbi:MAG: hypothetical protein PVG11_08225 [Anaerolineae bacterium]|jgi:hypothetical protein
MVEQMIQIQERVLHVRFEGRSWDVALGDLGVEARSTEGDVRRALARYLDVPEAKLAAYVVEWHGTGNVTVRPEAVFG